MRERDRIALREWRRELAAEEAAERERQERPIREAEAALQQTQRDLLKVERNRLLGETDDPFIKSKLGSKPFRDPTAWDVVDPLNHEDLPDEFASALNAESIRLYLQRHPEHRDFLGNKKFRERVGSYFDRNGIKVTSAQDIERVVERFLAAGLGPESPAPAAPFPQSTRPAEPEQPSEPEYVEGWDSETGRKRDYSQYEIARMSADEYMRTFRLHRAEMLDSMR